MLDDQLDVDPVRRKIVQHAIIRLPIDTPEPRSGDVSDPRRELEPEQVEYSEYRVGVAGRIGHDLGRPQFGFLVQHDRQQMKTVTQCAGDRQGIQPGKAVGNQIVPGNAAFAPEIAWVRAGVDRADRHGEPQPIGRGDLAASPGAGQRYPVMRGDQQRVGGGQCLGAHEVLLHPAQSRPA